MSLSVGIVGLPNVGKSTLFKALTNQTVDISNYPFCTIEPNTGIVTVPDQRLISLSNLSRAKEIVPAVIKFLDIAGLVKGAAEGQGLGNQFLAHIREVDIILHLVRRFQSEQIAHVEADINPERDIATVNQELILKDIETIDKRITKIQKAIKAGDKAAIREEEKLKEIKDELEKGNTSLSASAPAELFLLTAKPQIYLFNADQNNDISDLEKVMENKGNGYLRLDIREELDITALNEEEKKDFGLGEPQLDKLIKKCYQSLSLITFFTITGGNQTRAWPIKKGADIIEAAGMIHNDFAEHFITASVINWQALVEAGGWKKAKEEGLLKTAGRDYVVNDGDVVKIEHG